MDLGQILVLTLTLWSLANLIFTSVNWWCSLLCTAVMRHKYNVYKKMGLLLVNISYQDTMTRTLRDILLSSVTVRTSEGNILFTNFVLLGSTVVISKEP